MDPEDYRPYYHFTPPQNWMNDPNGLVHFEDEYHLFYQHNPYGKEWGHMSWGHAVSQDLLVWEHLPLAIPEEPRHGYTIFSGSAVIDHMNSSGLGRGKQPVMVAIYTADTREQHLEDIHIAYSTDGGRTFDAYRKNPVISTGESKFGDPKVFWHAATERWVLVAICGHEQGHVAIYGSSDLVRWSLLSEFHAPDQAPHVWECPDLFPLAVDDDAEQIKWVLKTNWVNPGSGESGTSYFIGDFDGAVFSNAVPTGEALTARGGAIYAEVSYNDAPDDQRILMGWLRQAPHPERPWTGAQALPRLLTLRSTPTGVTLCQEPLPDLEELRYAGSELGAQVMLPDQDILLDHLDLSQRAIEIDLAVEATEHCVCGLRLDLTDNGWITISYDADQAEVCFTSSDGQKICTTPRLRERILRLRIFLDQELVEVFANRTGGLTACMPFGSGYERLSFYARHAAATLLSLSAWTLGEES